MKICTHNDNIKHFRNDNKNKAIDDIYASERNITLSPDGKDI